MHKYVESHAQLGTDAIGTDVDTFDTPNPKMNNGAGAHIKAGAI